MDQTTATAAAITFAGLIRNRNGPEAIAVDLVSTGQSHGARSDGHLLVHGIDVIAKCGLVVHGGSNLLSAA